MTDETNTGKKEDHGKPDPAPIGKAQPVDPPTPPINSIDPEEQVASKSGTEKPEDKCDKSKEILVRIIEDDTLSTFENKTLFWGRAGIVLAIVTLVVGIATLIVFYSQLSVMQNSLDEAESDSRIARRHARQQIREMQAQVDAIKRQMRQEQRPWLAVKLNEPLAPNGGQIVTITDDQPLIFPLLVTNIGKSAARNFDGGMFVEVVENGKSPKLDSTTVPPFSFIGGIMFPNSPSATFAVRQRRKKGATTSEDDPLKPSEHKDLLSGKAYMAIYGTITYNDVFDIPHWTKFCMGIPLSNVPYTAKNCAQYNNVDNN